MQSRVIFSPSLRISWIISLSAASRIPSSAESWTRVPSSSSLNCARAVMREGVIKSATRSLQSCKTREKGSRIGSSRPHHAGADFSEPIGLAEARAASVPGRKRSR